MKLPPRASYDELYRDFVWAVPDRFNIGERISDAWAAADPDRVCLQHFEPDGNHRALTYGELSGRSNALANAMAALGIAAGDRVALLLPQGFDTVIAHAAIYKMGAIALPLALLFGADALKHRLKVAGAVAIFTDRFGLSRLNGIRDRLPELRHVIVAGDRQGDADTVLMAGLIDTHARTFGVIETGPDDPALMIFTSGTTGPPKAALHGHRVLAGHLPGFQLAHDFAPQPGDRIWTPSDWAWAGGLLNVVLPSLMLGIPVVSSPAQKFDPLMAVRIMAEMQVRNAFIPPTALRLIRSVPEAAQALRPLGLRTVTSAGEALGRDTYSWARDAFGVTVNEFYGQTECNFVLASAANIGISRGGSTGLAVPGHQVNVVDRNGDTVAAGRIGQIAIRGPDPVMFLGYWQDEAATRAKFMGEWLLTGDLGRRDARGYFEFFGRDDDIITSSGYRIGPSEIEDCLLGHPAVRVAGVVGKPDPLRTEIVKAYVVLNEGFRPDDELAGDIREWVKSRLSMHEYPREIAFIDEMPMTTSGKIVRRALRARATEEALMQQRRGLP